VLRARQTQHKLDTMRLSLFTESPESVYYTLVDEWSNNQQRFFHWIRTVPRAARAVKPAES
jgi:hypothetical protein